MGVSESRKDPTAITSLFIGKTLSGESVGRIPGLAVERLARTAFVVLLLVEFGVDGAVLAAEVRLRNSFKSLVDCPRQIIVIKNNVPNSNDLLAEVLLKCAAARGKWEVSLPFCTFAHHTLATDKMEGVQVKVRRLNVYLVYCVLVLSDHLIIVLKAF